jgi:hypothetical protein
VCAIKTGISPNATCCGWRDEQKMPLVLRTALLALATLLVSISLLRAAPTATEHTRAPELTRPAVTPGRLAQATETPRSRGEAVTRLDTVEHVDWAVRVIPLPHEMKIEKGLTVRADQIHVQTSADSSPQTATAVGILATFARGAQDSPCRVRLALSSEETEGAPDSLLARLRALPNPDQAYAMTSRRSADGGVDIILTANNGQGLLYAARTLQQLVSAPASVAPDTQLALPLGEVVDWPDIPERGQWGEDPEDDLAWMSRWKLNVVEVDSRVRCDEHGKPTIGLDPSRIAEGEKLGIKVVPFLPHLEGLSRGGLKGWEDCYGTPTPERAERSDFHPGLCMSNPRTTQLLAAWLKAMVALPGVRDIMVWLSEEATPCCCERCKGAEPYSLEVAAVLAAFREAQAEVNPKARLRILTTQGSYPVNDKILAAAPEDVGITYYDGGRTYDSSHSPMIYPLLERFARSGRRLGVYPQVTNAWGTILPWTGPQFIKARMAEFAEKKLTSVICYAVPSHRFHQFNMTAAAEWSWNHTGRTPHQFARAFARAAGFKDIDAFADWAEKIGPVGWDLAGARLFLRLMYDPSMGIGEAVPLDHRYEGGPEVMTPNQIERDLAQAREALAIARRMKMIDAVDETRIDIAGIKLLRALYQLSHAPADPSKASPAEIDAASQALDTIDQCAAAISTRLRRWGERICAQTGEELPGRLSGTVHVVLRAADTVRELVGTRLGIADPHPEFRCRNLGAWSARDFASGPRQTLRFDATAEINQPGNYSVCLHFVESAYGLDVHDVRIVALDANTRRQVLAAAEPAGGVSTWSRYRDTLIPIPEVLPKCRYVVEIDAKGLPADAPPDRKSCSGTVGLRRDFPERFVKPTLYTR